MNTSKKNCMYSKHKISYSKKQKAFFIDLSFQFNSFISVSTAIGDFDFFHICHLYIISDINLFTASFVSFKYLSLHAMLVPPPSLSCFPSFYIPSMIIYPLHNENTSFYKNDSIFILEKLYLAITISTTTYVYIFVLCLSEVIRVYT